MSIVPVWWEEARVLSNIKRFENGFELASNDGQNGPPTRTLKVVHSDWREDEDRWLVTGQIRLPAGSMKLELCFPTAELKLAFLTTGNACRTNCRRHAGYLIIPDCGRSRAHDFNFSVLVTEELETLVTELLTKYGPQVGARVAP